jgi:hypothetical protein
VLSDIAPRIWHRDCFQSLPIATIGDVTRGTNVAIVSLRFQSAAAVAVIALAQAGGARAATTSYTDFSAFQAAVTGLTTDSFDAAPWNPTGVFAQGTSNLGVSWTAANFLASFSGISRSGANAVTSQDLIGADLFDLMEAVMPSGTKSVGGWITSFNMAHDTEMQAYDAANNLLGSISLDNTGNNYEFLGLISDTAIAKVRILSKNVVNPIGDDFALDDFTFGGGSITQDPAPVPEPATLALFGIPLAALALRRRVTRG